MFKRHEIKVKSARPEVDRRKSYKVKFYIPVEADAERVLPRGDRDRSAAGAGGSPQGDEDREGLHRPLGNKTME